MRIKKGVRLDLLQPQMTPVMIAVERIWWVHGRDPTITSGNDGKHRSDSLHYQGLALDFRTKDLSDTLAIFFRDQLVSSLGENYDVLLEFEPRHMHIEYDPDEV